MCSGYTQNVHITTITAEEATVIETVRVHTAVESFGKPKSELHAVFVTNLRH